MKKLVKPAAIAFLSLVAELSASQGSAQSCASNLLTSLVLTSYPGQVPTVAATVNNQPMDLALDSGASFGILDDASADKLGLKTEPALPPLGTLFGGIVVGRQTTTSLRLGSIDKTQIVFGVTPFDGAGGGTRRILGADTLDRYNIEFDFGGREFKIYSQAPCNAGAIASVGVAPVAIELHAKKHDRFAVDFRLNGRDLSGFLDTGAQYSVMSLSMARDEFGLDESDPAMGSEMRSV